MTKESNNAQGKMILEHPGVTRREFIGTAATGAAVLYTSPVLAWGAETGSRVVKVHHAGLVNPDGSLNPENARAGVDRAVELLTGKADFSDAWQMIFPKLQSTDTIGLKVNCISRKCPTHPEVAYGIAESMVDGLGMNPNNIIIWDRTSSELKKTGYTLNRSEDGIRCFGTVENFSIARWIANTKQNEEEGIGYDRARPVDSGDGVTSYLSNILTRMSTYLINVPVLKDHGLAGVTLSMKNHYGSIDNPRDCHSGFCDPFIARINAHPQIRKKTKLVICDAALGVSRGGPRGAPDFQPNRILASFDPVAIDYTGMQMINERRKQNNDDPVTSMAVHIETANALGLGTGIPEKIELKEARIG